MKRFLLVLLVFVMLIPVALGLLVLSAIEDSPLVTGQAAIANSEHAARVRTLVQRYRNGDEAGNGKKQLTVTEQDLESLIAFAARGVPSARADAQISEKGLDARLTIDLPRNPIGNYINLGFYVVPSDQGIQVDHITIGNAQYPAQFLVPAISWLADVVVGKGSGETLTSLISGVRFPGNVMVVTYLPGQDRSQKLSENLNTLFDKIKSNEQLRIADPEIVQIYFSKLQEIASELRGGYVSLTRYIAPLFELAVQRSGNNEAKAVNENQAAIMALAIYFGDNRMKKLVDDQTGEYFSGSRLGSHNVTIKKRHDLVQHYLTSAGLQIAAGVNMANAIGEFKEIADTLRGGSGFSFSDIAGDRAGVTLAEHAIDANRALQVQNIMANAPQEDVYFPDITGLLDNMSVVEFEQRFGDVEDPKYLQVMADIERRIAVLPAYKAP